MRILPELLHFIKLTCMKNNIDESHALGHSLNVLHNAHQIYQNTLHLHPVLKTQENVIYTAALLHDMCDKKYVNQAYGIEKINDCLSNKLNHFDILFVDKIITTMSYSTVKKEGYPSLGKFQMAYHIVREADLLSAYDFDRSIIYHMYNSAEGDFNTSYKNAVELFENRVLKHHTDDLFVTEYSKRRGHELYYRSLQQMTDWKHIIRSYNRIE